MEQRLMIASQDKWGKANSFQTNFSTYNSRKRAIFRSNGPISRIYVACYAFIVLWVSLWNVKYVIISENVWNISLLTNVYLIYLGQVVSDTFFFSEKVTDFALSEWENCHFCFKKNKIKLFNSKHLSLPLWAFTAPNFNTLVYSDILGWTNFWSSILMSSNNRL